MNNKLNEIENFSVLHLLKINSKKNQIVLKNNNEKDFLPKFKLI
jgi:hypothetical protein